MACDAGQWALGGGISLLHHRWPGGRRQAEGRFAAFLGKRFPDQTGAPGGASWHPEKMPQKLVLQTPTENYSVMVVRGGGGEGAWLGVPGLRLGKAGEALARILSNQSK